MKLFPLLFLLPLVVPTPLLAQEADRAIVVSALRVPQPATAAGQSVTVLTEEEIADSQAVGLAELLARTPGVQFARNGGPGSTTTLFVRGAEGGQTLVLYDGVPLSDASSVDGGISTGADLLAFDVARVEVLRGAQSALWGSQAIGGVVAIITRLPEAPLEVRAEAEAGGLDTVLGKASLGGRSGAVAWRLGGGAFATEGVSAFSGGTERDGYRNVTLGGRLDLAVTDGVTLDLRTNWLKGKADFDGFAGDSAERADSETWLAHAGLTWRGPAGIESRLSYQRTAIDRTNVDEDSGPLPTFEGRGRSERIGYQGIWTIGQGAMLVFGAEQARGRMDTASQWGPPLTARDRTRGAYAMATGEVLPRLTLSAGLRHEDHSTFGGHTVGSAAAAWSPREGTVLRAAWSEGFRAPSLYQLYSEYGNGALVPERATSWEAGLEQHVGHAVLSANWFRRETAQLVDFVSCFGAAAGAPLCADGRFGYYDNVGRVEAEGLELSGVLTAGQFSFSVNGMLLDARNVTAGSTAFGKRLARRPARSGNVELGWRAANGLALSASLRLAGEAWNDSANLQRLAPYAVIDVRASYPLSDRVELHGRLENLFNERYELVGGYGTLPRVFHAGVRWRW